MKLEKHNLPGKNNNSITDTVGIDFKQISF